MKFDIPHLRKQAQVILKERKTPAQELMATYIWVWAGLLLVGNILTLSITEAGNNLSGLTALNKSNLLMTLSLIIPLICALAAVLLDAGYSAGILSLVRGEEVSGKIQFFHGSPRFSRGLFC